MLPPGAVVGEVGVIDRGDARAARSARRVDREVVEHRVAPLAHQQAHLTAVVRAVGDRGDLGTVDRRLDAGAVQVQRQRVPGVGTDGPAARGERGVVLVAVLLEQAPRSGAVDPEVVALRAAGAELRHAVGPADDVKLQVRYPNGSLPGSSDKLERAMWLSFFFDYGFRRKKSAKDPSQSDLVLERRDSKDRPIS